MRSKIIFITLIASIVLSNIFCCYLSPTRSDGACADLQAYLVDRDEWSPQEPQGPMECLWGPVYYVIIHHTVTGACNTSNECCESMRKMQKDHVAGKKWPDVGYHFAIGGDGKAYVGRPWNKMGGHTKNQNRKSIGIAFLGDYSKGSPSAEMLDLVPKIAYCGVEKGYLHPNFVVIGHKDAFCSTCPGEALYGIIKTWSRFPKVVPIPSFNCDSSQTTTTTTTTTTEPTTTEVMTTERTATDKTPSVDKGIPVYIYLLLSKPPFKCCYSDKWFPND